MSRAAPAELLPVQSRVLHVYVTQMQQTGEMRTNVLAITELMNTQKVFCSVIV